MKVDIVLALCVFRSWAVKKNAKEIENNGKIRGVDGTEEVFGESWIITVWRSRGDVPQELHETMNSQKAISWSLFWVGLIEKIMGFSYNSIHFPIPSHQWTYSPASLDLLWGISVLPSIAEVAVEMLNPA